MRGWDGYEMPDHTWVPSQSQVELDLRPHERRAHPSTLFTHALPYSCAMFIHPQMSTIEEKLAELDAERKELAEYQVGAG